MPRKSALALAIVFVGVTTAQFTAPRALAAPAGDEPVSKDPVGDATKIRDEAKSLFKSAGDPDADAAERSKSRKECFKKLKHARKLLDDYLAAHPDEAETHDALYCDLSSMLFWVKKELTLEEIKELQGGTPSAPTLPPSAGGAAPGSGIGGAQPRDPAAPPAGGGPGGPGGGASPGTTPPVPTAPPAPAAPTLADELAQVTAYAAAHPGDVPGQYERYAAFLDKFQDPSTPEYAAAAAALKSLDDRMKDVYRTARDEDPESIRTENPAETEKRLKQLLADLASNDDVVRARAAKFLGYLGAPEAVPPLLDALRVAREGPVLDATSQALADLGSRRVYERLLKAAQKDTTLNAPVLGVLTRALSKGGPAGRLAGETLARFAEALPIDMQATSIAALRAAGAAGAPGLAYATVVFAPDDDKAALIDHVGALKDPRTVTHLARFLFVSPTGRRRDQASAARDAIETIGRPGVRYLIPALDDPSCQLWTAELLRKITGTKQKDDKRKTWEAWFRKNRKSLE